MYLLNTPFFSHSLFSFSIDFLFRLVVVSLVVSALDVCSKKKQDAIDGVIFLLDFKNN